MAQNEIIEGMAVEEVVASKPRFGKKIIIGLAIAGGSYLLGRITRAVINRKNSSNEEAIDYETEDYEDITEDDENPVDSDVE